jgi:hypothetical protein
MRTTNFVGVSKVNVAVLDPVSVTDASGKYEIQVYHYFMPYFTG